MAEAFRRIREEQLSSEEMRQVVIGGTVEKEEVEGTESVVRWETLVPPDLAPEVAPDPRNGCCPPRPPCGWMLGSDGSLGQSKYDSGW